MPTKDIIRARAIRRAKQPPPDPIDPALSARRRAAGLMGAIAANTRNGRTMKITLESATAKALLPMLGANSADGRHIMSSNHHLANRRFSLEQARDLAAQASPGLVGGLVDIASDTSRSVRDRVSAARLVFDVAGAIGAPQPHGAGSGDVRDMDAVELHRLIAVARAREAALEAVDHPRSDIISDADKPQAVDSTDNSNHADEDSPDTCNIGAAQTPES